MTHIEGEVNPVRDLEIINEELRLKDIEFLGIHREKLEKLVVRGNDKKLKPEYVSTEKKSIFLEHSRTDFLNEVVSRNSDVKKGQGRKQKNNGRSR